MIVVFYITAVSLLLTLFNAIRDLKQKRVGKKVDHIYDTWARLPWFLLCSGLMLFKQMSWQAVLVVDIALYTSCWFLFNVVMSIGLNGKPFVLGGTSKTDLFFHHNLGGMKGMLIVQGALFLLCSIALIFIYHG